MKKLLSTLTALAIIFLYSCSNDNEGIVPANANDELLNDIDIETIATKFGEKTEEVSSVEPIETIVSVDTLYFETEEEIIDFFEKRGLKIDLENTQCVTEKMNTKSAIEIVPIKPGYYHYTSQSKTGYTSRTQGKATMYLIDNATAKFIGKGSGYYLAYTYNVKLIIPANEYVTHARYRTHYKDFFLEESPNCGYVTAFWNAGYIAISGKDRGYAQNILSDGKIELSTYLVEIVANRNGTKVNKWVPCHLNDIVWNYGRMSAFYINYPSEY